MFLRPCRRRKNGKTHTYWALVQSHRTPKGSRQRVVAYLGELTAGEQSGWAKLGRKLAGTLRTPDRVRTLFDLPPAPALPQDIPEEVVRVQLKGVRLERLRDFGDVYLGWCAWRMLGLDELLEEHLPPGREDVPWSQVAAILTLARLCEPSSERHIENVWYARTALNDILGVPEEKVHTDRLYAGLDELLPLKEKLERHLRQRTQTLFDVKAEVLLYDVTSTYFEGACAANPTAKRGYSRDSRPDCLQVLIGLVVTEDGFPLGYEVFDGNKHDSTTLHSMIEAIEAKYGRLHRVWIMDRGMVSEANLAELRQQGSSYIVGTPKAQLTRFADQLKATDWRSIENGVEVKLVRDEDAAETYVLVRSADRRLKEKAMHGRFEQRLEAGLKKLHAAAEAGRLRDLDVAHQRLGRLKQQYSRAGGAFDVQIVAAEAGNNTDNNSASQPDSQGKKTGRSKGQNKVTLTVTWTRNSQWTDWARLSEGCYALRSNLSESDPQVLWKRYIQLTDVESAFRINKDELEIRPVWHQKEDRVKAHILVCFLAYALWKTLEGWMNRSGLGDAPRTVLEQLAKIKSGDVVLPTQTADGEPSQEIRLRCVTEPDASQKMLLNRLGLELPRRLSRPTGSAEM